MKKLREWSHNIGFALLVILLLMTQGGCMSAAEPLPVVREVGLSFAWNLSYEELATIDGWLGDLECWCLSNGQCNLIKQLRDLEEHLFLGTTPEREGMIVEEMLNKVKSVNYGAARELFNELKASRGVAVASEMAGPVLVMSMTEFFLLAVPVVPMPDPVKWQAVETEGL
jgi:hypothetical protein